MSLVRSCQNSFVLIIALAWLMLLPAQTYAMTDTASAKYTPWSGYWWPTHLGGPATGIDYAGHPAPLEKYDALTKEISHGSATQWYLDHDYDASAPNWYGWCGAWSAAAVMENIDFQPSILDKVLYNVGDKKALLTACHDFDVMTVANATDPAVFHAWLLRYIKEAGLSFYSDLDLTQEVWNYPIYKYAMTTSSTGSQMAVSCQIWYAGDQVSPDYQGTKVLTKTYTYTLTTNSNGEITGGIWTDASVNDHPQLLLLPISQHSSNQYLDCNLIRDLAKETDDDLESNQTVILSPGDYKLLLLNQDDYRIDCDPGDTIILNFAKDIYTSASLVLQIRDAKGNIISERALTTTEQEISIPAVTAPPYTLTFIADKYTATNVYSLNVDLKKNFEFANLKLQKGFSWGGFALTNSSDSSIERISVVGYDQNNRPLATYLGPFSLSPGQKQTLLTRDFDVLPIDKERFTGVKVMASAPLAMVNLFGYYGRNMSCYGSSPSRAHFVIPDVSTNWELYNPSLTNIDADLISYAANGSMLDATGMLVPANRALEYNSSPAPFTVKNRDGWVLVQTKDNGQLKSHTEWVTNGIAKAEALDTLGINRNFFVPQVISKGTWNETITLINASASANRVTLTLVDQDNLATTDITLNPFEKRSAEISALFPGVSDATLDRSAMEITAAHDLAGFINLATSGDDLYLPLLDQDDVRNELVIPQVVSDSTWWTGFALYNPSPSDGVSVSVVPTDNTGMRRTDLAVEMNLPPHSKRVLMINDLFVNTGQDISFVTFTSTSGLGLAGVYAIGGLHNPMLSGTVMR